MRIGATIALLLLLASCASKHITTSDNTATTSDSVVIKETVRYDTVVLPGERVTVRMPIPCPPPELQKGNTAITEQRKGGVLLRTWIAGNTIHAECQTDSLEHVIAARDTEITRLRNTVRTEVKTETITRYRTPWWAYAALLTAVAIAGRGVWVRIKHLV